jgi:hypothetical protein
MFAQTEYEGIAIQVWSFALIGIVTSQWFGTMA